MRLIPDWLLYIVVTAVLVLVLFRLDHRADSPEALPESNEAGSYLPPPSIYDPEVLVEVGPATSGLGTAFAISEDGWWVTARHVVDACRRVGLIVSRGQALPPPVGGPVPWERHAASRDTRHSPRRSYAETARSFERQPRCCACSAVGG